MDPESGEAVTEGKSTFTKVTDWVSYHPNIMIGLVIVLLIVIIYTYLQSKEFFGNKKSSIKKKKGKNSEEETEDKLDEVIGELNDKQKSE